MIFRRKKSSGLADALTELEQGVAARDGDRTERAFGAVIQALQTADDPAEFAAAGPRLAALLPQFPPIGPRAMLATTAGFCVEQGADAAACAEPILAQVRDELAAALEFAARWRATGPDELPEPDEESIDEALLARIGDDQYQALRLAQAWCTVEQWQAPALAVLGRSTEVRRRHGAALLPLSRELEALEQHDLKCLSSMLAVLDDEPLLVLHRPTGTGYQVRIGGLGDNFQLHTLLAHVLIGGGHLPGTAPSADSVHLAGDPAPADGSRSGVVATGAFELFGADGTRIWNEGTPDDIPVVDGHRLLVLDEPSYARSWNADRFFPMLPGRVELLRVLPAEETRAWLARTTG
ncbi:hypothetical protein [Kitasatospora sp. CB02891]|uniref:hypothetical protein n=1 Tax=Kitasatospora sp. CB02891 TaxID=2020329 RepID=UPI000C26EB48|nr:hypothetical protein [Kitasatospora sp. CB02891]PJN23035.1 hypothetical protein CG736_25045 [Kitasatospora sp. CB02891]